MKASRRIADLQVQLAEIEANEEKAKNKIAEMRVAIREEEIKQVAAASVSEISGAPEQLKKHQTTRKTKAKQKALEREEARLRTLRRKGAKVLSEMDRLNWLKAMDAEGFIIASGSREFEYE